MDFPGARVPLGTRTLFRLYPKPAPGYRRNLSTGALVNVGNGGYSWSSAVSGTYGINLNFGVTQFSSSNPSNHGSGFPLRCLSE